MKEGIVINISVIIPAYNSEATIVETIRSVQLQTINDWEIIVVDDGSTDKTVQLVNDLSVEDNRIRVIRQKNQHVSAARNLGIKNAVFDWLLFLDSDELLLLCYLMLQLTACIVDGHVLLPTEKTLERSLHMHQKIFFLFSLNIVHLLYTRVLFVSQW
jgi:glycosyltransferase involved in cell wall biosynthesis